MSPVSRSAPDPAHDAVNVAGVALRAHARVAETLPAYVDDVADAVRATSSALCSLERAGVRSRLVRVALGLLTGALRRATREG